MQIFFLNGLWRFLKNGHLPVNLHSSAPRGTKCHVNDRSLRTIVSLTPKYGGSFTRVLLYTKNEPLVGTLGVPINMTGN